MQLPRVFQRYRDEIDWELKSVLSDRQLPMYDMLRYHLGWKDDAGQAIPGSTGKALRSTLCLLTSEAICGEYRQSLPAAVALELVHNFSLIHDDIEDNDTLRRNRPTVWAIWGRPHAINAGTAMRVLANFSMMRLIDQGLPSDSLLHAFNLLDESCLRLIEGQYQDLDFEKRVNVGVDDYLFLIERKTVALIACSMELGAILATKDQQSIQSMKNFGWNLGLAFQIRDDILGIWGENGRTGKPVGSDIRRKKKSFPIVYAWQETKLEAQSQMHAIFQRDSIQESEAEAVLDILGRVQAKKHAESLVNLYCYKALEEIKNTPIQPWARDYFQELVQFLIIRDY